MPPSQAAREALAKSVPGLAGASSESALQALQNVAPDWSQLELLQAKHDATSEQTWRQADPGSTTAEGSSSEGLSSTGKGPSRFAATAKGKYSTASLRADAVKAGVTMVRPPRRIEEPSQPMRITHEDGTR